jgi:hypothetical protein
MGRRGRDRMHITTNIVSSNPALGEVHSIQQYVIKLVINLRQVCGFLRVLRLIKLKIEQHEPHENRWWTHVLRKGMLSHF